MILRYFTKRNWATVAAVLALVIAQVYFDLRIPGYMSDITDALQLGGAAGAVRVYGAKMIACSFASLAAAVASAWIAARVGADFSRTLRRLQFENVERFSMGDVDSFSPASLITRSTNDANQIQVFASRGLLIAIKAPIIAAWAILMIASSDFRWTAATAVAVAVIIAVNAFVLLYAMPKFRNIQWLTDDVNGVVGEDVEGVRVIRAYNAEGLQEARFDRANEALLRNNLAAVRAMAVMFPAVGFVMNALTMSIYFLGASIINDTAPGAEQMYLFSDMIVFSSYAMRVVNAFMMMSAIFNGLPRAMVSSKRIQEVITHEPSVADGESGGPAEARGEIEFRGVSFRYPGTDRDAVSDVSFKARNGETVAIVGATGSGKSTLANLIPRFYDACSGQVLVDGMDVREYKGKALRAKFGYVPQKAVIFSGSVRMNVNFGETSGGRTDGDVWEALGIAQASDFVRRMPEGLDSRISQYGTNVSGGQKQRISIARAVCRRPEFYILDDAFSALDYATDRALRGALKRECAGATFIVVAQRIGTVMDADRIIVLDGGKVVGQGTHRELLESCPVYREIAESQLSGGELRRVARRIPRDGGPRTGRTTSPARGGGCSLTWARTGRTSPSPSSSR